MGQFRHVSNIPQYLFLGLQFCPPTGRTCCFHQVWKQMCRQTEDRGSEEKGALLHTRATVARLRAPLFHPSCWVAQVSGVRLLFIGYFISQLVIPLENITKAE